MLTIEKVELKGNQQVMTWKLLTMALVIAFFMGVAFMATVYAVFKMF